MAKGNCEFKGSGGQYFGTIFIHLYLLGTITFGIYIAWAWARLLRLKASHTIMNGKEVSFEGSGGQLFGLVVVQGILTLVTFGIYGPWAFCKYFDWRARNTIVGGKPSNFNGSGGSLFIFYLIHLFILPMITLGLYYFWGIYRFAAWKEEHTKYGGEETSFGAGFWEFIKISLVTWILNTITLNLFAPWSWCMFCRWQIGGLAVGDDAGVEHFPPVKTNVLGVIILVIIGVFCLLAIGFLVKNAAERGWRQRQQFVRLKQLHEEALRNRKRLAIPRDQQKRPEPPKPSEEAAKLPTVTGMPAAAKSGVLKKLHVDMAQYADAMKRATSELEKRPEDAHAHYDKGWLYGSHLELERAAEEYTQAIHLDARFADAYYNRGLVYAAMGRLKEAARDFGAAIELNPKAPDAYCNRGNVYFSLGMPDKAISDYTAALRMNPLDGEVLYDRALVYASRGHLTQAKKDLRQAAATGYEMAGRTLEELENASSVRKNGWRMNLEGVHIPAGPASGRIHGDPVTIDEAVLEHSILTLRDGKNFFPDHAFMIFLFLKKGETPESKTYAVSKESGFGSPHIHMKWKQQGKDLPQTKIWMNEYAMLLQFGKRNGGEMPGKIYLCIPDERKSYVAGTFTAHIKS
jgi:tetratricopeptide (TPR) repeat protein